MDKKLVTINNLNRFKQCLDVAFQAIEESFIPVPEPLQLLSDGDVIENIVQDYDGNWYDGVVLNNKIWLKQNLKTTHYSDGTEIALGSSTSDSTAYRYYPNNNSDNVQDYGYLYNHSATQKVLLNGWHVSTYSEWMALELFLQGIYTLTSKKVASKSGWETSDVPDTPGNDQASNNITNLSMSPAGHYNPIGNYVDFGYKAKFRCEESGHNFAVYYNRTHIVCDGGSFTTNAASIRCVLDMSASDWFTENKGRLYLKNTSSGLVWSQLSKVAESGDYNDLLNRPTITSDILICNYNNNTMDKTIAEIYEASSSGKMVFCKVSNLIYILELSLETQCRFKSNVNSHGGMSFNWITGVNSNGTDTWTFGSNPYVPQEVFVCTFTGTDTITCNKSVAEIYAAYQKNNIIIGLLSTSYFYLSYVNDAGWAVFFDLNSSDGVTATKIISTDGGTTWTRSSYILQTKLIGNGTGQNIKTINGENILGSGNIDVDEVLWCTYDDINNTVNGLTAQQIIDAKTHNKIVCCKHGNYIDICTVASNSYIVFSGLSSNVQTSDSTPSPSGNVASYIVYNASTQTWGKGVKYLQELLTSGTNIKTVNNESILGSGNIDTSQIVLCNITFSDNTYTCDKSASDIVSEFSNGKAVFFKYNNYLYYCIQAVGSGSSITIKALACSTTSTSTVITEIFAKELRYVNSNWNIVTNNYYIQERLVSGTSIKTINNNNLLGSGDLHISGDIMFLNATQVESSMQYPAYKLSKSPSELIALYESGITVVVNVSNSLYYRIAKSNVYFYSIQNDYKINRLFYFDNTEDGTDTIWYVYQTRLQKELSSGATIKTINGESILGSGDIITSYSKIVETEDGDEDVVIEYDGDLSSRFVVDNKANSRTVDVAVDYPSDILYLYESVSTYQVAAGRIAMFEIRKADDGQTCIVTRTDIGNKITL